MNHSGTCPHCQCPGEAFAPCGRPNCSRRGMHYVPEPHAASLNSDSRDPLLGRLIGDFLAVAAIGRGSYGRVYLGMERATQRCGAIKLLTVDPDARNLQRFAAEAESLKALSHPNIIGFITTGVHEEYPYIVMEYADDATTLKQELLARIHYEMPFSVEQVRRIIGQLLDALTSSHSAGIIHRDIKPDNVLLQTRAGDPFFVRVVDFGMAKFVEEGTQTLVMSGTPTYMAPEQIKKRHLGPWTDLFAVAVVTYEMLTGARPYLATTIGEVFQLKLDPQFDPAGQLVIAGGAPQLVDFFRRAMAFEHGARFQSAEAFREALMAVLAVVEAQGSQKLVPAEPLPVTGERGVVSISTMRTQIEAEQAQVARLREELKLQRVHKETVIIDVAELLALAGAAQSSPQAAASPTIPVRASRARQRSPGYWALGLAFVGGAVLTQLVLWLGGALGGGTEPLRLPSRNDAETQRPLRAETQQPTRAPQPVVRKPLIPAPVSVKTDRHPIPKAPLPIDRKAFVAPCGVICERQATCLKRQNPYAVKATVKPRCINACLDYVAKGGKPALEVYSRSVDTTCTFYTPGATVKIAPKVWAECKPFCDRLIECYRRRKMPNKDTVKNCKMMCNAWQGNRQVKVQILKSLRITCATSGIKF